MLRFSQTDCEETLGLSCLVRYQDVLVSDKTNATTQLDVVFLRSHGEAVGDSCAWNIRSYNQCLLVANTE